MRNEDEGQSKFFAFNDVAAKTDKALKDHPVYFKKVLPVAQDVYDIVKEYHPSDVHINPRGGNGKGIKPSVSVKIMNPYYGRLLRSDIKEFKDKVKAIVEGAGLTLEYNPGAYIIKIS